MIISRMGGSWKPKLQEHTKGFISLGWVKTTPPRAQIKPQH